MLVSVCIPTYSRLDYLKQAVDSARNQIYPDIEICISQNPKNDGPDKAISEWCSKEIKKGNVVFNINKENRGLTGNLNVLAGMAKGAYIIFLGDDDLLHPEFVNCLINEIRNSNAAVGFSNQFFIDKDGKLLQNDTAFLNDRYHRNALAPGISSNAVELIFNNSVPLSAALIRKDLFLNYKFNESLNTPELPFFLRVALDKNCFVYVKKQLAYYRLHKNSETANGLAADELLKEIINIPVPVQYETIKRNYISGSIVPAINNSLKKGNVKLAEFLLHAGYYPKKRITKLLQEIMCYLPSGMVRFIFSLRKENK